MRGRATLRILYHFAKLGQKDLRTFSSRLRGFAPHLFIDNFRSFALYSRSRSNLCSHSLHLLKFGVVFFGITYLSLGSHQTGLEPPQALLRIALASSASVTPRALRWRNTSAHRSITSTTSSLRITGATSVCIYPFPPEFSYSLYSSQNVSDSTRVQVCEGFFSLLP